MVKDYIYTFSITEVGKAIPETNPNGKVNFEKLYIEIFGSEVPGVNWVKGIQGEVYCSFINPLDDLELDNPTDPMLPGLIQIIHYHDGIEPETSEHKQVLRKKGFDKVVQTAKYHPDLDDVEINGYLTTIDNWKNSFITDGVKDNIIGKLFYDAGSPGDASDTRTQAEKEAFQYYPFLTRVVNTDGVTVWQFLIDQIGKIQDE